MISLQEGFGAPYDKEKFEEIKSDKGPAAAISWARKNGVPEEEVIKFALEVIEKNINEGDLFFVYRFRKSMGIGTSEEIKKAGEEAYELYSLMEDKETAMQIAKDVWGKESKQYQEASQIEDEYTEIDEENSVIVLPKSATFEDLFARLDEVETDFDEELIDNFGQDIIDEIGKNPNANIIDFFAEHEYSQDDIEAYLPIRFE